MELVWSYAARRPLSITFFVRCFCFKPNKQQVNLIWLFLMEFFITSHLCFFLTGFQTQASAAPDWIESCVSSMKAWVEQAQRKTVIQQRESEGTTKEQEENKEWRKTSSGVRMILRLYVEFICHLTRSDWRANIYSLGWRKEMSTQYLNDRP